MKKGDRVRFRSCEGCYGEVRLAGFNQFGSAVLVQWFGCDSPYHLDQIVSSTLPAYLLMDPQDLEVEDEFDIAVREIRANPPIQET